jgi:hypothetical protein
VCYVACMLRFRKGDLIAKMCPAHKTPIQFGIIIEDDSVGFSVKWTSFNKTFFMEKEGEIFQELNNIHLLNIVRYCRDKVSACLVLLNSNYMHGKSQKKSTDAGDGGTLEKNNQADCRLY